MLEHFTAGRYQVLIEIPAGIACSLAEPPEHRVHISTPNSGCGHHRKRYAVLLETHLCRVTFVIVLLPKIIAGKANNRQSFGLIGLVELFQAFELRRVAAVAGGVDDE